MISFVTRSYIVILFIVLSACGSISKPDWVVGNSVLYNPKSFLLGHGIGQDQIIAQHNATLKIKHYFNSVINADELRSQLNIIFNQIEYKAPWKNGNTGKIHVLAYISRNKAASLIQSKMLALDELTFQFFDQAKATTDLLSQTSYIDGAINTQSQRLKLKPVLDIINSQNDIPSSYNIKRLSKIRTQLQTRINLQVDIRQDTLGELDSILKNSLDRAGFIRNDNKPSKNHLIATLTIDESNIADGSGAVLIQGVLLTALQQQGDSDVRAEHQWTFTVSAKDHISAVQKSRAILSAQLNSDLKQVIMDMMILESELDSNETVPNQDYVDIEMPEFNDNVSDSITVKKSTAILKPKVTDTSTDSSTARIAKPDNVKNEQDSIEKVNSDKKLLNNKEVNTNLPNTTEIKPTDVDATNLESIIKPIPQTETAIEDKSPTNAVSAAVPKTNNNETKTETETNNSRATDSDDPISTLPPLTSDK